VVVLIVLGALIGGGFYAKQVLDKRQSEIERAESEAKARAAAAEAEMDRFGHLSILSSIPPNAVIMQNGEPLLAQTGSGAWTELRAGQATRISNIKIEEDQTLQYTLVAEGHRPYTLSIGPSDWLPQPGTGDFEKAYSSVRLEPISAPVLKNCEAIAALGPAFANACSWKVSEEIATRLDYERIYNTRLRGKLIIKSDPPGARVLFLAKPLMLRTADGTEVQATTSTIADKPLEVSIVGKNLAGEDKFIDITDELSVRLELEGHDPYLTTFSHFQWHCTPRTDAMPDLNVLADPLQYPLPVKLDPTAPDLLHHLCDYTYVVDAKLRKTAPPEEAPK
jgi:hypothetical protein